MPKVLLCVEWTTLRSPISVVRRPLITYTLAWSGECYGDFLAPKERRVDRHSFITDIAGNEKSKASLGVPNDKQNGSRRGGHIW